ncbi:MAG: beta-lactamase family protein [Candidatus Eremiobacteraeota bacterium]|nr:beta-lactamase family protein [Candidatus Eremiobacteraeota bacterium]
MLPPPAVLARLDATVRFVMREQHIDGLVVGVGRDGVTVFVRGYGYADRASRQRVDARTIFSIGSLTKSFTAALVRDRFQPEDALARYIPEYPNAQEITIDELLRGTAGVPDYSAADAFDRSSREPLSPQTLVERLAAMPPAFAPGTDASYSNGNYFLAAFAYERATGTPFAAALQRRILRPLGLARTEIANAFVPEADRATGSLPPGSATLGFGSADLESDVPDLLAWYAALDAGARVKSPRHLPTYADGFYDGMAFGQPLHFASGYVAGFSAYGAMLPKEHASVVVLANRDAVDLGPLGRSALALAIGLPEASAVASR